MHSSDGHDAGPKHRGYLERGGVKEDVWGSQKHQWRMYKKLEKKEETCQIIKREKIKIGENTFNTMTKKRSVSALMFSGSPDTVQVNVVHEYSLFSVKTCDKQSINVKNFFYFSFFFNTERKKKKVHNQ